jgi:molybdate transport system ATP-binding protein
MILEFQKILFPLEEFTLEIDRIIEGEIVAIVGPSGAGKSTLLEIIAGLHKPSSGLLKFNDTTFSDFSDSRFIPPSQRKIGYCPQDPLLFPHRSVRQNITFGMSDPQSPRFHHLVEFLNLSTLLDRFPQNLSGGEKQRVALARAIACHPRLLLLDEPFSSLDPKLKQKAITLLQEIHQEFKIPMLFVSHDPVDVESLCDQCFRIHEGKIL